MILAIILILPLSLSLSLYATVSFLGSGNRRFTSCAQIQMRATRFPLGVVTLYEKMPYNRAGESL